MNEVETTAGDSLAKEGTGRKRAGMGRDAVWGLAASGVGLAGSLLALPVLTRSLGTTGYGMYATFMAWAALLGGVLHGTLSQPLLVLAARHGGLRPNPWTRLLLAPSMGSALLAGGVLWSAVRLHYLDLPALAYVPFVLVVFGHIWTVYAGDLLRACGAIVLHARIQMAASTVRLVLLVGFVTLLADRWAGAVYAAGLAALLLALAFVTAGLRIRRGAIVPATSTWRLARQAIPLHAASLALLAFGAFDRILVSNIRGFDEAGAFDVSFRMFSVALLPAGALVAAAQAHTIFQGPGGDKRRVGFSIGVGVLAGAALLVGGPLAVRVLAGRQFLAAVAPTLWLSLGLPAAYGASMLAGLHVVRGRLVGVAVVTALSGAMNVALDLILIPRSGGSGAAFATALTYYVLLAGFIALVFWPWQRQREVT